ncbi:hypothetical protein FKW77_001625 [Venturia effusa]|uniref:DNA/RNA-binding domain-containing protein n=1 Tax=Venturia effusa TaxID=50376 RepID=A0A517LPK8_9PEZI|nr:hypothetical protein FKW77_001625 [Venturia effusa]
MDRLQELSRMVAVTSDQKFGAQYSPTPENDHRINIELAMAPFRDFSQDMIINQIIAARKEKLDNALWQVHTKIHGRFRNALQKLASQKQQKTTIHRQTVDDYLRFLKATQKSYRTFLCSLNAAYPTLTKLRDIALKFNEAPMSASVATPADDIPDELKNVVLDLVHETLLHLGDLSRWRFSMQLGKTGPMDWKNASGYYDLANEVLPNSGFGKHQQAVLALSAHNYFYGLSHLYDSLCSEIQHPEASQNLDLLVRKRLNTSWDDLVQKVWSPSGGKSIATLRAWFLKFHQECYQAGDFSQHDQMESEIMTQLSNALETNADLRSTLTNMVKISIGGEFVALEKVNRHIEPEKNVKACLFLLHHNVNLFRELLRHLYDKLENQSRESVSSNSQDFMSKVPPVAETTLQCIRIYTLWMVKTWSVLQNLVESGSPDHVIMAADIRDLWHIFADCLNAIYQQYPLPDSKAIDAVEYLLTEDENTLGFRALHGSKNDNVWMKDDKPKAIFREQKSDALQEQEHLIRLRDIVTRGFIIAQEPASPFILVGNKIEVNDAGTTSDVLSPTPAPEYEGEPITPPPTAGGDQFVATAEGDQYDHGLWLDGTDEQSWNVPPPPQIASAPLYGYGQRSSGHDQRSNGHSQQEYASGPGAVQSSRPRALPNSGRKPKPPITIEQLVQEAYCPQVQHSKIPLPAQLPWVTSFPVENRIWRNDDPTVTAAQTKWLTKPFETKTVYPERLDNV